MSDEIVSKEELEALLAEADAEEATAEASAAGGTKPAAQAETASTVPSASAASSDAGGDTVLSSEEIEALLAQANAGGSEASSDATGTTVATAPSVQAEAPVSPRPSLRIEPEPVVRPVEFSPLTATNDSLTPNTMDLILDVNMNVAVELGQTTMQVRDILALGPGSVIELDKHAGEPVEVVVNNKVVARGEVVVIDENFGVRITQIINAKDKETHARAAA